MAFLSIAGVAYQIQTSGAAESEGAYVGEAQRSASGQYRSGRRLRKRSWSFTLRSIPQADYDAFLAVIGIDTPLTVTGDAFGGASITAVVIPGAAAYLRTGTTFLRTPTITVTEI